MIMLCHAGFAIIEGFIGLGGFVLRKSLIIGCSLINYGKMMGWINNFINYNP